VPKLQVPQKVPFTWKKYIFLSARRLSIPPEFPESGGENRHLAALKPEMTVLQTGVASTE
jgi:hypothetical protein